MPRRSVILSSRANVGFADGIRAIERELSLSEEFPTEVLDAAEQAAASPKLPDLDRTDIAFVTLDPPGSKDLDQALHIERRGDGYRLCYAIADVAAFVEPGGAIDLETHRRGQTLYAPDHRIPLHPAVLSEGAASLLPDQVRPALLWTIDLDSRGEGVKVDVVRARVRSRAQLDYAGAQASLDAGTADDVLSLLKEVGELRLAREHERGGISLPLPDQEVVVTDAGWSLEYRKRLPIEDWNAQISLLTGMQAAELMLYGEEGIVRTLPPASEKALLTLRHTAVALHFGWDPVVEYPDFVRMIDPNTPTGAAMLTECTSLFRGAAYVAFDGGVPERVEHAALATEYAHVTAPLRRLCDRYAGEIALSLCAGTEMPDWVRAKLRELPKEMERSDRVARKFERAVLDLVEAGILTGRVGQTFDGVVTDVDDRDPANGVVVVQEPAIEARVLAPASSLPLGEAVRVTLTRADVSARTVIFELAE
ncbi:MAG: RNB domain-containing ribonuclease [Nocardioidaceae bacterium]|nr:RNB domain-containing ribonuclease [Nocardioidaceae bacterium]